MNRDTILFDMPKNKSAAIKVIGVGGGGSNAVNYMYEEGILGVDFVICNTDAQALTNSPIPTKIQLGTSVTEGLGAGANPEVGKQSAIESAEEIKRILDTNTKMVFITAGMGGGTGTGAAPIIAGMAKEAGILTVGIVTVPFYFEGARRLQQAELGVAELRENVDSLIVINNDKLRELYGNLGFKAGFAKADEVLAIAAKGIAEVITNHYKQNIDLRDAKTVLANSGTAIMGSATASGVDRAKNAIVSALDSPLLNNNKITGAQNVLLLIVSGNEEVTIDEISVINEHIQNEAGYNANIIMGIGEDENLVDGVSVTIVATGFPADDQKLTTTEKKLNIQTLSEDLPIPTTPNTITFGSKESANISNITITENIIERKYKAQKDRNTSLDNMQNNAQQITITQLEEEETVVTPKAKTPSTTNLAEETAEPYLIKQEIKNQLPTITTPLTLDFDINTHFDNPEDEMPQIIETPSDELQNMGYQVTKVEIKNNQPLIPKDEDLFDMPLDALNEKNIQLAIEERRNRLKEFNYNFKKSTKEIEDSERIPAYKRQGIELKNNNLETNSSRLSLNTDRNKELQIRINNSFLHDNVD